MKRKFGFAKNLSGKAYSLIELSIVLVIISLLITGAMTVSIDNLKTDQTRLTKERMDKVYKALGSYIRVNKSLPCPAPLTKVKSVDSDYGTSGSCVTVSGVTLITTSGKPYYVLGAVPTLTLGLPSEYAEDGFGNKIVYFVEKRFTTAATLTAAPDFSVDNFSTMATNQLSASPSDLWLIQSNPAGSRQDITRNAVLGMVSAGQNKLGAYNTTSSSANTASSDTDEATNYNAAASTIISSSPTSSSFDDLVFYKTMKDIIADYPDVMYLVPCDNTNANYINGSNTGDAWYDGVVYSKKAVCSSPNQDLRFSKKCGTNGNFMIQNESCSVAGTSTCSLTNNQNVGTGAKFTGTTQTYSNGSLVPLSCRTNFGRSVIGGSRASDDITQTCSLTTTDRSTTAIPQAVCSNGTLYVINDCTACRSCSSTDSTSSAVFSDATVTETNDCNTDSRLASSIVSDCRSNGAIYNIAHTVSADFGHVKKRKCGASCNERNVCNVARLQCLDGYFTFGSDATGQTLGSDTTCNTPVINCLPSTSQSPGGGC